MRANQTIRFFASQIVSLPLLSEKEKDILTKRLDEFTLKKIGKGYKVTGERIRQIEKRAITKVKIKSYQPDLFE